MKKSTWLTTTVSVSPSFVEEHMLFNGKICRERILNWTHELGYTLTKNPTFTLLACRHLLHPVILINTHPHRRASLSRRFFSRRK
ncbi:hypothetical protein L1887_05823 [Cichorium endivia]|nr:hypothetical protein L1887_05823 [Cichorium endivia]